MARDSQNSANQRPAKVPRHSVAKEVTTPGRPCSFNNNRIFIALGIYHCTKLCRSLAPVFIDLTSTISLPSLPSLPLPSSWLPEVLVLLIRCQLCGEQEILESADQIAVKVNDTLANSEPLTEPCLPECSSTPSVWRRTSASTPGLFPGSLHPQPALPTYLPVARPPRSFSPRLLYLHTMDQANQNDELYPIAVLIDELKVISEQET